MKIAITSSLRRLLITLTIFVFFSTLVGIGDLYLFSMIHNKATLLASIKETTAVFESQRLDLVRQKDRLDARAADYDHIQKIFIDSNNPLLLIEALEKIAKSNAIKLKLASPEKREHELAIHIEAEGGRENVLKFISDVENLPYQAVIRKFSFEKMIDTISVDKKGKTTAPDESSFVAARFISTIGFIAQ